MHYLRLALLAEGTSDHRFLPVVLRRLTLDLCAVHSRRQVEIEDEMLDFTARRIAVDYGGSRLERIQRMLSEAGGIFNILFIHADGGGNPDGARETQFKPLASWTRQQSFFSESRSVAVVPVREMEAWALADGEALRSAFGTILTDEELEIPSRPQEVESISDPKQALESAYSLVVGRRRRRKERAANFLSAIAERIRLDLLRRIPAFQTLESDLLQALDELGYLR